jgi:hypothetical protein
MQKTIPHFFKPGHSPKNSNPVSPRAPHPPPPPQISPQKQTNLPNQNARLLQKHLKPLSNFTLGIPTTLAPKKPSKKNLKKPFNPNPPENSKIKPTEIRTSIKIKVTGQNHPANRKHKIQDCPEQISDSFGQNPDQAHPQ